MYSVEMTGKGGEHVRIRYRVRKKTNCFGPKTSAAIASTLEDHAPKDSYWYLAP